jgi:predicted O-methyltransferase YrrM
VLRLLPYAVAALVVCMLGVVTVHWLATIALNLAVFTLIAFACHGEAYRRRPEPARLTEFYLWTSFGGVVGGVFAGLIAPNIFPNVYEYRLLIAAALLALPGMFAGGAGRFARQAGVPLALAAALVAVGLIFGTRLPMPETAAKGLLVAVAVLAIVQVPRHAAFFGLVALSFVMVEFAQYGVAIKTARSFFGVLKVVETPDGRARLLFHGTTIHGAELVRDEAGRPLTGRPEPLTYYYFGGPISEAVEAVRQKRGTLDRVAAVGLGAGSMACHRHDGERWTFFEIDPEVIRLAEDETMFRFLSACGPVEKIVPGDGRITLAASSARYDLILLDAFSSDSIPVHLITREAFAGYLGRLAPNGAIVIHISNKHMELASVVAAVAAKVGLVSYFKRDHRANDFLKANTEVMVLARSAGDLGDLPSRPGWTRKEPVPGVAAWTDDYSDVLRAILRRKFGAPAQ